MKNYIYCIVDENGAIQKGTGSSQKTSFLKEVYNHKNTANLTIGFTGQSGELQSLNLSRYMMSVRKDGLYGH